jgi:hypothetical protein
MKSERYCNGWCLLIHLQHGQKRFLRNLYAAKLLHPLLAFLLQRIVAKYF